MTKHSSISGAPLSVPAEGAANSPTAEAGSASDLRTLFRDRTEPCPVHDNTTADSCEHCWGGFIDSACADCLNVKPLNDDGICRQCHLNGLTADETAAFLYLEARPIGGGSYRVEM